MITVPVAWFLAVVMSLVVGVGAVAWVRAMRLRDRTLSLDPRYIWFCSVCTYTYINTHDEIITTCPRCGSYNKK
jgi:rubrerythrin